VWPFRKSQGDETPLKERLESLERRLRAIETEWLEYEAKVTRVMWRTVKARGKGEPPVDAIEQAQEVAPAAVSGVEAINAAIRAHRRTRVTRLNGDGS
jgi:hypothetical protein